MSKKPARKPAHAKPPVVIPGGTMVPAGKPARKTAHARHPAKPPVVIPGGVNRPLPAAKKKRPVKRKLALGESVACCAAEALAASLRLTGVPVSDSDVLAIYWHTASDADAGATILATLEAACRFGVAGIRPVSFREVMLNALPECGRRELPQLHETRAGLILGGDLPGPHALYDDGTAWWSWGEPYDRATWPDAVIEEAWEVRW